VVSEGSAGRDSEGDELEWSCPECGASGVEVEELLGSEEEGVSVEAGTSMTDEATPSPRENTARLRDVNIKINAAPTVTLLRKVPGPRLPKTVWLDPPNAAPISAPFPACKRMEAIMRKQTVR